MAEHSKTSHKSCKNISEAKKVSQIAFGKSSTSHLYRKTKRK